MEQQAQEYCLRVEAVNLDHAVFDTHNISTIRGGSFMLLEVVKKLHEKIPKLQPEITDASVGLFRFSCLNDQEKDNILVAVEKELEEQTGQFATFVCACMPSPEKADFAETEQRLMAKCRRQQYQTLSFALPENPAKEECEMNGVRPADETISQSEGRVAVSVSVKKRFKEGKRLRNELYWNLLGEKDLKKTQFTSDLESIAGIAKKGSTEEKIALIHLDGNKFGTIRANNCLTIEDFKDFNRIVQKEIQEPALTRLLKFATKQENKGFRTKHNEVRLETLMWGGDEVIWIVPASQLWDTLQIFFDSVLNKPFKEIPFTYSAGVVICRHTVPILQIRHYAEQLCGIAKNSPNGASSNQFALLNMSSFDAIHKDVGTFLNAYYHPATANDFIVPFSSMSELRQNVRTIRKNFPKNKIYEIIGELKADKDIEKIVDRGLEMVSKPFKEPTQKAIEAITASNPNQWFLISDLWSLVDNTAHEPAI